MNRFIVLLVAALIAGAGINLIAGTQTRMPFIVAPVPPADTATSTTTPTSTSTATATFGPTATNTATPTNTPTATEPSQQGPCPCNADVRNCSNFSTQPQAQACFDFCVGQGAGDIHKLDQDNDGVACESLPPGFSVMQ